MRLMELDLLRFIAVLLVLGRHMRPCPEQEDVVSAAVTAVWQQGGWIGVDLFFVLSGFLVSGLLFREYARTGHVRIKRFLIRRGFKIYPSFWVLILATLMVAVVSAEPISKTALLSELLFVQNYLPRMWGHTWSLAVEEHFYILLSVLVAMLVGWTKVHAPDRSPFHWIPPLFVVVACACLVLRIVSVVAVPETNYRIHLYGTHIRIDSLMFGVLLSYYWNTTDRLRFHGRQWPALCLAGGITLCVPAFIFSLETWWMPVFGVALLYLGSGAVLIALLNLRCPSVQPIRLLAALGAYSYSIYLWHLPMQAWFAPQLMRLFPTPLRDSWHVYAMIYLVGAFVIGVVFARLVEIPTLRVRDRFFPSNAAAIGRTNKSGKVAPARAA